MPKPAGPGTPEGSEPPAAEPSPVPRRLGVRGQAFGPGAELPGCSEERPAAPPAPVNHLTDAVSQAAEPGGSEATGNG